MGVPKRKHNVAAPRGEEAVEGVEFLRIPWKLIRPFEGQPRTNFPPEKIDGLARSIKKVGQQAPVKVRRITDDRFKFEFVDGECRSRACEMAEVGFVDAIVVEVDDVEEQFIQSVASNFCKSDHTTLETARALQRMVKYFTSQNGGSERGAIEDAADVCGRSPTWADQHLRLLRLIPTVQKFVDSGELMFQAAVSLSSFKPGEQFERARHIIGRELTLKRALSYLRREKTAKTVAPGARLPRPTEDYFRILDFLKRLEESAEGVLDLQLSRLMEIFSERDDEDLYKIVMLVEDRIAELEGLKDNVETAIQKKGESAHVEAA